MADISGWGWFSTNILPALQLAATLIFGALVFALHNAVRAQRKVIDSQSQFFKDIEAIPNAMKTALEATTAKKAREEAKLILAKDAPDLSVNIEEELFRAAELVQLLRTVTPPTSSIETEIMRQGSAAKPS